MFCLVFLPCFLASLRHIASLLHVDLTIVSTGKEDRVQDLGRKRDAGVSWGGMLFASSVQLDYVSLSPPSMPSPKLSNIPKLPTGEN